MDAVPPSAGHHESHPEPYIEIVVHRCAPQPGLTGACNSYECGNWRYEALADHMMEWLPEFVLKYSERRQINDSTAVKLIRRAASKVYQSKKFEKRGEFGELLLHILLRQVFHTLPAVSKIYYKTGVNDPVKGFDAVHVVINGDELELWLGEAKFYDEIDGAINSVASELQAHSQTDYLRNEFSVITSHIDANWPQSGKLKQLLDPNVSLDRVFARACIPVLLTYDSAAVRLHSSIADAFIAAVKAEFELIADKFHRKCRLPHVIVHLFLFPLASKAEFVNHLDRKLRAWQSV